MTNKPFSLATKLDVFLIGKIKETNEHQEYSYDRGKKYAYSDVKLKLGKLRSQESEPFYCAANIDEITEDLCGQYFEFSNYPRKEWFKGRLVDIEKDSMFLFRAKLDIYRYFCADKTFIFMRPIQKKTITIEEARDYLIKKYDEQNILICTHTRQENGCAAVAKYFCFVTIGEMWNISDAEEVLSDWLKCTVVIDA